MVIYMIEQYLLQIKNNHEVRQSLSELRKIIKTKEFKYELLNCITPYIDNLILLLNNADAKTRKNAVLLMGDLGLSEFLSPLVKAYTVEQTLFVRSSYLTALLSFDCSEYMEVFQNELQNLQNTKATTENKKHIEEEIRALSKLIIKESDIKKHTFTGFSNKFDCILLTNKEQKDFIKSEMSNELTDGELLDFPSGVRVITDNISELLDIRTYSELLFVIPNLTTVSSDAKAAATKIVSSKLLFFLSNNHKENSPFYFRIDLKSNMALDEKAAFSKKLAFEIEKNSNRKLINTTSNYEITLRLIENKLGTYHILLKLHTLIDERFSYREQVVSSSINPVDAALFVSLAKDYMIENSRTLDPFCGVGTLLIERQKIVKGNTSYGIDFYEPAIEKAKINTENAGQIIHYINRNFFDFTHEHLFDEIFTNMPSTTGRICEEETELTYRRFFEKSKEILTNTGTIIMYTHDKELVEYFSPLYDYDILDKFLILKKKDTWIYILKRKS